MNNIFLAVLIAVAVYTVIGLIFYIKARLKERGWKNAPLSVHLFAIFGWVLFVFGKN